MYISDDNYREAIENLEDCMFASWSMLRQYVDKTISLDDLKYISPRLVEAMSIMTQLASHPKHHHEFAYYLLDQRCVGAQCYHWQGTPVRVYGDFTSHIGNFLQAICMAQLEGQESTFDGIKLDALLSQADRNRQAVGLKSPDDASTNPTENLS